MPVAPPLTADRRGSEIQLTLTAPAANVDGSRPANITRIDIYAVNGALPVMTDVEFMKRGTKVASIPVKAPKDPNAAVEQDEPAENAEPPVGDGLDQGASSSVTETITASVLQNAAKVDVPDVALIGPPASGQLRTYVGVGVDRRGHPGQFSKRVSVPLQLPPPPPPPIAVTYDEKKIVITWKPEGLTVETSATLPSRPFGPLYPDVTYNLYDAKTGQKLNDKPIREVGYEDTRMDFGTERCYNVRAVEVIARLPVESEASGPFCEKLVDTFPPATPKGLNAVATQGAINLIWEANAEPDLAGYFVWRAIGDAPLQQITPTAVTDASFFDGVRSGLRFRYAVQAVDKAGNRSAISDPVEEIAR
jgi:hypothetical protein